MVFSETELPEYWLLGGRIGVQLPGQSWHAAIRWNQHGDDFEIRLRSPLGQGLGSVEKRGNNVVLVDGKAQTHHHSARELDDLISEQLEVPVPVGSLRYWVLGQPHPGRSWQLLESSQGRPQGLLQVGWDIRFDSWFLFDGRMLPARLTLRRDAIRVRLVLHEWAAAPVEPEVE